ncbi:MAG TPA: hypothetical protein VIF57_07140, partial [Polyangia bacterium]
RAEEPPPEVVQRIERALGISVGGAAIPAARAEAPAVARGTTARGLSALRLTALSALGVGGAVGLVLLLARPAAPPPAPELRPPAPEIAPAAGGAPSLPAPGSGADEGAAAAPVTGGMRDEIALIDGARAALGAGAPARALSLLDRYRARHPRGVLLPEALAMRVEAIDRTGDHRRARALARAFLADYPQSPLAQRVARFATPAAR